MKRHEESNNSSTGTATLPSDREEGRPAKAPRQPRLKKEKKATIPLDKFGVRTGTIKAKIHACVTRRHQTSDQIAAAAGLPRWRIESRLKKCVIKFPDLIGRDEKGWFLK